jgi:hypothetical protein
MAYCTIAEALEDATFKGWIKFPDKKNNNSRGLLFDTPNGAMCILWDRTDGYVLTSASDNYVSPEAWVDTWTSRVELTLPCKNNHFTLVNPIGQKEIVSTKNNRANIRLTGAPVIVYGLDSSVIQLH